MTKSTVYPSQPSEGEETVLTPADWCVFDVEASSVDLRIFRESLENFDTFYRNQYFSLIVSNCNAGRQRRVVPNLATRVRQNVTHLNAVLLT